MPRPVKEERKISVKKSTNLAEVSGGLVLVMRDEDQGGFDSCGCLFLASGGMDI